MMDFGGERILKAVKAYNFVLHVAYTLYMYMSFDGAMLLTLDPLLK